MVFPAGMTPWDDEVWGADINFDAIGHVSDHDAESYDAPARVAEKHLPPKLTLPLGP